MFAIAIQDLEIYFKNSNLLMRNNAICYEFLA